MTKLISLRVVIAADDDALLGDIQRRLQAIIEQGGTERLSNGENAPDEGPRVHWNSVDVLQGVERSAPPRRGRKPARTPGQAELST